MDFSKLLKAHFLPFRRIMLAIFLTFLITSVCRAQEHVVSGVITDENNVSIPGVNVIIKGTTKGAVSDVDGKFSITVPDNQSILVISYMGYETQEIKVGEQTVINVALKEKTTELDQIVVVGYGVQKKSDLTGAISSVSGNDLVKTPNSTLTQALQGKAAGVQVFAESGMPGANIVVRVRGVSTVQKDANPLYIIDGVSGDINSLNPNDIESIEVLKDASSQAIYGSAGGNGVIMVTTKKGSKSEKAVSTFTMYRGIQDNRKNLEVANKEEYITLFNYTHPSSKITDSPDSLPYTNWWDEVTRQALIEEYNYSLSGGSKTVSTMLSLGYFNQDGIVKKTNYKRYSIRFNSDTKLTERIKIGENIALSYIRQQGQYDNASWGSIVNAAITTSPLVKVGNAKEGWGVPIRGMAGNPSVGIFYGNNRVNGTYRAAGNLFLEAELIKNLTYTTRFGGDVYFYEMDNFTPKYYVVSNISNGMENVERTLDKNLFWNWQHVLDYKNTFFEKHNLELMAGFESGEYRQKTMYAKADSLQTGGSTPEFRYLSSTLRTSTINIPRGSGTDTTSMAYFGRINYDFNKIILAQFSIRYDGSSKFGPKNYYGTFPAFSFGLKFSELSLVKDNFPFISFGKLRYGWGKTGNSQFPANKIYSLIATDFQYGYAYDGSSWVQGSAPLAPGNLKLHWEDIVTHDIGIDLGLFGNKVTVNVDYYDKKNEGMLVPEILPAIAGRYIAGGSVNSDLSPFSNIGGLSNKGVEISLGYKNEVHALKYSFDLNITKIISSKLYNMKDSFYNTVVSEANACLSKNGYAPSMFYGYKTNGIYRESDLGYLKRNKVIINQLFRIDAATGDTVLFQPNAKPGDVRFVDVNGDGRFTNMDKTIIGNPNPDYTFGFSGSLQYKWFDMNFFFQGSYGNDIINALKGTNYNLNGDFNWKKDALNAYRSPVKDATTGEITDPGNVTSNQFRLGGSQNYFMSDWYVEDGSYIRLKSVQVGFTLPQSLNRKVKIERLRIYVGAKNLITMTNYKGTDPEVGSRNPLSFGVDYGVYPQVRTYMAGLELTF